MKRLLLILCWLASMQPTAARKRAEGFDLPYTVEHGKYIVVLETPAGPRRFFFDTGAARTCISETLSRELGLVPAGRAASGDYEGHQGEVACARVPWVRMGKAAYEDLDVFILPDSSYAFRCFGIDGIAGSDLLRGFIVRMPNPDSTILLTTDRSVLKELDRRRSARIYFAGTVPLVAVRTSDAQERYKIFARFDTGSTAFFDCRYDECSVLERKKLLRNVRRSRGYPGNMGWTNRVSSAEAATGRIFRFELAGQVLTEAPFRTTGGDSKLGCGLFRWGSVVIDYPGRRFWLLPRDETVETIDSPQRNVTLAFAAGRLIVGRIWDEALQEIIAPGDRIVRIGTSDVSEIDPCTYLCGDFGKADRISVRRKDDTIVTVEWKIW